MTDPPSNDDGFEPTLAGGMLRLGPSALADAILAAPLRAEADLVALDPAMHHATLVVKRGSASLGTFMVAPEVGMAAALRVLAAASIDPLALPASGEAANRVRVRIGEATAELLVCARARAGGSRSRFGR